MRSHLLARFTLRPVGPSSRTRARTGAYAEVIAESHRDSISSKLVDPSRDSDWHTSRRATPISPTRHPARLAHNPQRDSDSARIARMRIRLALFAALGVTIVLQASLVGQRAPFATPAPGSGPTPMRPYAQSGGCCEEPVAFHRCAIEKMKIFSPPRTPDGKPDFSGFWNRIVVRNMENIEEHPQTMDTSGGKSAIIEPPDGRIPYQPWAAARRDEMFATYVNPMALCTPLVSPKQAYGPGTFRV